MPTNYDIAIPEYTGSNAEHVEQAIEKLNLAIRGLYQVANQLMDKFYDELNELRSELSERNIPFSKVILLIDLKANHSLEISWRVNTTPRRSQSLELKKSFRTHHIPKGKGALYSKRELKRWAAEAELPLIWKYETKFASIRHVYASLTRSRVTLRRILNEMGIKKPNQTNQKEVALYDD